MQPAALPVVLRGVTLMIRADAQEALPSLLARVIAVARAEQVRPSRAPHCARARGGRRHLR